MTKKSVSFHDTPPTADAAQRYKKAIEDAKRSVPDKSTGVEGAASFTQAGSSWRGADPAPAREFLSGGTKEQLQKLSKQMEAQSPKEESTPDDTVDSEQEAPEEVLDEAEKLKRAVEARVSDLDIGQYIMSGVATQNVPVIPGKLEVVFRTITDGEETYVDKALSRDKEITSRQFVRKNNEYALAMHLDSVNGNKWPNHLKPNGEVDLEVMEIRLGHIRKLSSPIFNLLVDNLNWFLLRIHKELTFEVLGNG